MIFSTILSVYDIFFDIFFLFQLINNVSRLQKRKQNKNLSIFSKVITAFLHPTPKRRPNNVKQYNISCGLNFICFRYHSRGSVNINKSEVPDALYNFIIWSTSARDYQNVTTTSETDVPDPCPTNIHYCSMPKD